MSGNVTNVPIQFNVKLAQISGHLPYADTDSHLLVVRTCTTDSLNGIPPFRRAFYAEVAGTANVRPLKLLCCHLVTETIFYIEMKRLRDEPHDSSITYAFGMMRRILCCSFNLQGQRRELLLVRSREWRCCVNGGTSCSALAAE